MGKKGKKRGKGAIPIVQTSMLAIPVIAAFKKNGLSQYGIIDGVYDLTGFSITEKKWLDPSRGVGMAIALIGLSTIGNKVANRVGANKLVKKATGGYFKLV